MATAKKKAAVKKPAAKKSAAKKPAAKKTAVKSAAVFVFVSVLATGPRRLRVDKIKWLPGNARPA